MSPLFRRSGENELVRQIQERYSYVLQQTTSWIGDADRLRSAGKLDEARAGYERIFNLVRSLEEDQGGVVPPEFVQIGAASLERIGDLEAMKDELQSALTFFEKSLELYESAVGASTHSVQLLGKIAGVFERGNVLDRAREAYEAALELTEQVGEPPQMRSILLNNVGRVYALEGDTARGVKSVEQAVAIDREEGADPVEAATHLSNLGEGYYILGDLERAERCFEEAARLQP